MRLKQFYRNETHWQWICELHWIESYASHFDMKGPSNLTEMVSMIGMKGMVLRVVQGITSRWVTHSPTLG